MENISPNSSSRLRNTPSGLVLSLLLIALIAGSLGYAIASVNTSKNSLPPSQSANNTDQLADFLKNPTITSMEVTAVGNITQVKGNQILVEAPNKKDSVRLLLSPKINITTLSSSSSAKQTKINNPTDIQLNKRALINISYQGGTMLVTSISYIP